jgi:hypothetical protein
MIVRDAASTIEASLASALPFIDTWTVVDTGSQDSTADLVEWMLRGVPGSLYRRSWRDFGTNRSEALQLAHGSGDYLLLLDADETISGAALPPLWMDGYDVHLVDEERWAPRIIRADLPWRFLGAARAHLSCAAPVARRRLRDLSVRHHQTASDRVGGLERDAQLLRASLETDPTNLRSEFELALVLLALGERGAARAFLERCLAADVWDELSFCSEHQLARLAAQDDRERGMRLLLETWESRPSRIEPLFDLARLANETARPTRALLVTAAGMTMREPPDELMVQPWVYRWRMRLEHARSLHLLDRGAEATRYVDELLADPALPSSLMVDSLTLRQSAVDGAAHTAGTRAHAEDVSAAHLGAVPMLTELVGNVATIEVGLPVADPWRLTSASVAGNDHGFALHLTAADSRAGRATSVPRHFLQTHDDTGARLRVREILDEARHRAGGSPGGLNETRLFWWEDGWRCLGSGHGSASDASGEGFLIGLGSDGASSAALAAVPPASDGSRRDMMPVVVSGRLFVVTGLDPFELVAWDRARGRFEVVTRLVSAPGLAGWIGGSSGLQFADGFLFVIRRVRLGERSRLVTHRFLAVDDRLCPVAASREFVFQRYGGEVCRGLARWGDEILCSYASEAGRGWMTAVPCDVVRAGLLPLT